MTAAWGWKAVNNNSFKALLPGKKKMPDEVLALREAIAEHNRTVDEAETLGRMLDEVLRGTVPK
jgi:hypothetical protein